MECSLPAYNSNDAEILKLLKESKNIAVVGLSPDSSKPSHRVASYLQSKGYKIFPIYPKESEILGEKVYRKLEDIEEEIDIVNLFRKPEVASEVVKKMKTIKNIKAIWLQLGITNNEAAKDARDFGFEVVQNKCIMIEHRKLFND
ncbi:MAG: uncharacterized protein QG567_1774 [Campylobacterota bacterium]|nr:uncharacterized protein [Campylobacterota bacterium]